MSESQPKNNQPESQGTFHSETCPNCGQDIGTAALAFFAKQAADQIAPSGDIPQSMPSNVEDATMRNLIFEKLTPIQEMVLEQLLEGISDPAERSRIERSFSGSMKRRNARTLAQKPQARSSVKIKDSV